MHLDFSTSAAQVRVIQIRGIPRDVSCRLYVYFIFVYEYLLLIIIIIMVIFKV